MRESVCTNPIISLNNIISLTTSQKLEYCRVDNQGGYVLNALRKRIVGIRILQGGPSLSASGTGINFERAACTQTRNISGD